MKTRKTSLIILMLVAWIITACGGAEAVPTPTNTPIPPTPTPLTAEGLIEKSNLAMKKITSFRLDMDMQITVAGQEITQKMEGVFEMPDRFYMKMDGLGGMIEILSSGGKTYMKAPGATSWTEITPEEAAASGVSTNPQEQLDVSSFAKSIKISGEETIDGFETQVLEFEVDIAKYIAKDPSSAALFNPDTTTGMGKMWVGKDDAMLRKLAMEMKMEVMGQETTVSLTMIPSGFNEPVEIPTP